MAKARSSKEHWNKEEAAFPPMEGYSFIENARPLQVVITRQFGLLLNRNEMIGMAWLHD